MNQRRRIEAILAEGPCTSGEIAAGIGLSPRCVSAYLSAWHRDGKVVRERFHKSKGQGGRPPFLYRLAGQS